MSGLMFNVRIYEVKRMRGESSVGYQRDCHWKFFLILFSNKRIINLHNKHLLMACPIGRA